MLKRLLIFCATFVVVFVIWVLQAQAQGLKMLPSVSVNTLAGEKIDAQNFCLQQSKPTVYVFWATWCGPCRKELKVLSGLYEKWKKEYNVEIVAVATDDSQTAANVQPVVQNMGLKFEQVWADTNQSFKHAVGFNDVPFLVLTNANCEVVYTHDTYVEGDEKVLEEHIKRILK